MHELITQYRGAPHSNTWWHLLDDDEVLNRQALGHELPVRDLRWGEPPANPDAVEELRVWARDRKLVRLPPWVARLPRLAFLELPIRFMRSLETSDVPPSVEVLDTDGAGAATVRPALVLPGVTFLLAGKLSFSPASFPSLDRLSLDLDRAQRNLSTVAAFPRLRALHLSSVHAKDLFGRIGALPLGYLGLFGGKLASLRGIGALAGLRNLSLKNLPMLTDLTGIEELGALEELSIGFCSGLSSVRAIAALPRLRRLMLYGLRRVGVDEIRAELEAKGLEQLSLGGAT